MGSNVSARGGLLINVSQKQHVTGPSAIQGSGLKCEGGGAILKCPHQSAFLRQDNSKFKMCSCYILANQQIALKSKMQFVPL